VTWSMSMRASEFKRREGCMTPKARWLFFLD
jgi:hypothetical protein